MTLEELNNKETEKKKAAAESMKSRCKVCFKETAPIRECRCTSSGGGGGSGGSDDREEDRERADDIAALTASKPAQTLDESLYDEDLDPAIPSEAETEDFDPEIIALLITLELLNVDSNRQARTLSINLLCEPKDLSEPQRKELKKYMTAILKELQAFKEEKLLSDEDLLLEMTQDNEGNILSLSIELPTVELYDAFIQRLADRLVPTPKPKLQSEEEAEKEEKLTFNPSPFSMTPR